MITCIGLHASNPPCLYKKALGSNKIYVSIIHKCRIQVHIHLMYVHLYSTCMYYRYIHTYIDNIHTYITITIIIIIIIIIIIKTPFVYSKTKQHWRIQLIDIWPCIRPYCYCIKGCNVYSLPPCYFTQSAVPIYQTECCPVYYTCDLSRLTDFAAVV